MSWFGPLLALAACRSSDTGTTSDSPAAVPDPWADLDPVDLDPFRLVFTSTLDGAVAPSRLVPIPVPRAVAVTGDPSVHVLDPRYQHTAQRACIDPTQFEAVDDGVDRHGSCAVGEVELRRGEWSAGGGATLVAAAADGDAWLLDPKDGTLLRAATELVATSPWDWMQPRDEGALVLTGAPTAFVAWTEGGAPRFATAAGSVVTTHAADGSVLDTADAGGAVVDLLAVAGDVVAATDAGAWSLQHGALTSAPTSRVASDGTHVWLLGADRVVAYSTAGVQEADVAVADLAGALAADAGGAWVTTSSGISRVTLAGDVTAHAGEVPVDLTTNDAELVSLFADGRIEVHVDETALGDAPALRFTLLTFFENPHNASAVVACTQSTDNMAAYVAQAKANRAWLADQPAPIGLGITPTVVSRADGCGFTDDLDAIVDGTEPGLLFHDPPDCTDQDCLDAKLQADAEEFASTGLVATWTSGAPSYDLPDGVDWVEALDTTPAPRRILFFGMSESPDVGSEDLDPRGKEPYPWRGLAPSTPWRVASAADGAVDNPAGTFLLYPGNNTPAFSLGGCANLLVKECHVSDRGGGTDLDDTDLAVLDLLLHRALYARSDGGTDTFTFHLPAIEAYDYTADCTESDRVWSGDACGAAKLQAWLFDVQQRFVDHGLVAWTRPSELPTP